MEQKNDMRIRAVLIGGVVGIVSILLELFIRKENIQQGGGLICR